MASNKLIEAYSRLKALKENVPGTYVAAAYVTEFHEILDILERVSGTNLANFRIPAAEFKPAVTSINYVKGGEDLLGGTLL
jgi:hypothetical protein